MVVSPQNDNQSIPYLIAPHILAPGDRKLFSTDISIKSHILGEVTRGESCSLIWLLAEAPQCCPQHMWSVQGSRAYLGTAVCLAEEGLTQPRALPGSLQHGRCHYLFPQTGGGDHTPLMTWPS